MAPEGAFVASDFYALEFGQMRVVGDNGPLHGCTCMVINARTCTVSMYIYIYKLYRVIIYIYIYG